MPDQVDGRPDAEGDRMRISPLPTLAARLSIGGLAAWAACGALPAAAAVLAPAPTPTPTPTSTATPTHTATPTSTATTTPAG
jgi:hypothetical protein